MKKALLIIAALAALVGCSKSSGGDSHRLKSDTDSVAYVVGMNIGLNLIRMDSTINVEAVCRGIRDMVRERNSMTLEEAETFFLGYMNHTLPEKAQAIEEQLLADIAASNRNYARTRSGITYAVEELGDQDRIPAAIRDSLYIRYSILSTDEKEIYSSYERGDTIATTYGDLKQGLQESIRLIGEGGKIVTWIPSRLAFAGEGNEELNIGPNQTLRFEIELVKLDKYSEWQRR